MSRNEQSDKKTRTPYPRNEKGTVLQSGGKPPAPSAYGDTQETENKRGGGTQT